MQQVKLSQFWIQEVKRLIPTTEMYQDQGDDKSSDDDEDDTESGQESLRVRVN